MNFSELIIIIALGFFIPYLLYTVIYDINSKAKKKKSSPTQNPISSHKFINATNECCKDFLLMNFSKNNEIDEITLRIASTEGRFENMSHEVILGWNCHYRCTSCQLIWELSPSSHGQPGYFRPLEPSPF